MKWEKNCELKQELESIIDLCGSVFLVYFSVDSFLRQARTSGHMKERKRMRKMVK